MKNQKAVAKKATHAGPFDTNKNRVLQTTSGLARAGYGFLLQFSDSVKHLYLVSGEVYRVGESDVTRIR